MAYLVIIFELDLLKHIKLVFANLFQKLQIWVFVDSIKLVLADSVAMLKLVAKVGIDVSPLKDHGRLMPQLVIVQVAKIKFQALTFALFIS